MTDTMFSSFVAIVKYSGFPVRKISDLWAYHATAQNTWVHVRNSPTSSINKHLDVGAVLQSSLSSGAVNPYFILGLVTWLSSLSEMSNL
jgi:hypothetical protein